MHAALAHGHDAVAVLLIAHGADLHAVDHFGLTPMLLCATFGSLDVAKVLLNRGVGLHEKTHMGSTLMAVAAGNAEEPFISMLAGLGVDVNEAGSGGCTPLHHAAARSREETALCLIGLGAQVNAKNDQGETPLEMAAKLDRTQMAFVLIAHGASFADRPKTVKRIPIATMTARQAAVRGGLMERLKVLLGDPDAENPLDPPKKLAAYAKKFKCADAEAIIQAHLAMSAIDGILQSGAATPKP